eukprot:COSAG01_NODE_27695_length_679_cov_1.012069_1_plen_104_part_00
MLLQGDDAVVEVHLLPLELVQLLVEEDVGAVARGERRVAAGRIVGVLHLIFIVALQLQLVALQACAGALDVLLALLHCFSHAVLIAEACAEALLELHHPFPLF